MHQLPEFITFTGIDDQTDLDAAAELAALYPIEFGVLFSPKRQGLEPRYPRWDTIQEAAIFRRRLRQHGNSFNLAAHLCGEYANDIVQHGHAKGIDAVLGRFFDRAQVNHREPDTHTIGLWAKRVGIDVIAQHRYRDGFVTENGVHLLFDQSGGRGLVPDSWPMAGDDENLYGYAGGLNPDNVGDIVKLIGKHTARYWIDMETGVRDENDRFSLEKCRAVCESVYGKSLFA